METHRAECWTPATDTVSPESARLLAKFSRVRKTMLSGKGIILLASTAGLLALLVFTPPIEHSWASNHPQHIADMRECLRSKHVPHSEASEKPGGNKFTVVSPDRANLEIFWGCAAPFKS
jgi:hypothetical protein